MLRDVTEQHELEEQLRQSQKMEAVGRLAGGVAHDFNNILGIISGYAELLQMNSRIDADRLRAEKILSATEKAASLTRQLLAFGRKQVMSLELIDLSSVVKDLTSMLDCLMSAATPIEVRVGKNLGLVKADQSQLEQVILNLTANARDAMPHGGALTITVESFISPCAPTEIPQGEYVHLAVSDTGVGMSAEIQSRVFEPFFTTKKTGYGLGLSTVYGIIKQSGGHITVQSAPQAGSTFNIYLPVVAGTSAVPVPVEESKLADHSGNETILLVDDEEDLRNATCEYLEGCGYHVLTAGDGKEAIAVSDAYDGEIALLISDIVMPKMSGRGLIEHVSKTRPDTSILVMSGYADDAVLRHGILLEANCFVQKPFTFQALGAKIRILLDGPVHIA
jgi:CheY-like chemotaxis protein